jgi:hypothetical protein
MKRMELGDAFEEAVRKKILQAPKMVLAHLAAMYYNQVVLNVPVQTGALRHSIKISVGDPNNSVTPEMEYDMPSFTTWQEVHDQLEGKDLRVYVTTNKGYASKVEADHGVFSIAFIDLIKYARGKGIKLE